MWTAYSPRQSADLVGLTESAVRALVRAGIVGKRADDVRTQIGFSELALLRAVRRWRDSGLPMRTIRRELSALRRRTGAESLVALTIRIHRGHLVVTDDLGSWRADSGQQLFPFELETSCAVGRAISVLPDRAAQEAESTESSASEWFDKALELEELDTIEAIEAYRKVLELRPQSVETLINLGRLHAESGAIREAARCFERALEINPNDATASYNLGVVAQDAGDDTRAVELYVRALEKDPSLAEAHYNLATIYDRSGDPRAAIRHINEYRKLIRE